VPKFLFEASYTLDGVKGVQSAGGSSRRDAVARVAESVGGRLESFHFAFGDRDAYVIVDLPDNESATAVALTVNAAGGATVRTVVLLTPEEVDEAAKRSVEYRPPGACRAISCRARSGPVRTSTQGQARRSAPVASGGPRRPRPARCDPRSPQASRCAASARPDDWSRRPSGVRRRRCDRAGRRSSAPNGVPVRIVEVTPARLKGQRAPALRAPALWRCLRCAGEPSRWPLGRGPSCAPHPRWRTRRCGGPGPRTARRRACCA
jgi:uncharacterized protein with GYD domain